MEFFKYSMKHCLKGKHKERIWNEQEAERPERLDKSGGSREVARPGRAIWSSVLTLRTVTEEIGRAHV